MGLEHAQSIGETFKEEKIYRASLVSRRVPFGIKFLDDATGGMYPNDLIVVGAKPGVGKTEFISGIAIQNILEGKRVVLFALEAAQFEITTRIKYRLVAQKYFANPIFNGPERARFSFRNWYEGKCDSYISEIEREVEEEAAFLFKNLKVRYKVGDFSLEDLTAAVLSLKSETDVFIIDHLHYIDLEIKKEGENKALELAMKTLRDLSLMSEKPIVLVSHVRKMDQRTKSIIPDLEDLHGTSNISRICTKAILLAPAFQPDPGLLPTQFQTYIKIAKNRLDGSVSRFVAKVIFDISKNEYLKSYSLGRIDSAGAFEILSPEERPLWANF